MKETGSTTSRKRDAALRRMLLATMIVILALGAARDFITKTEHVEENRMAVEPYEITARLRRAYSDRTKRVRPGKKERHQFLEHLRSRYPAIDAKATGEESMRQRKQFRRLMREWNPVGDPNVTKQEEIMGTPTYIESVPEPGTDHVYKVYHYRFDEGEHISHWIVSGRTLEYKRVDRETGEPVSLTPSAGESVAPTGSKRVQRSNSATAGAIWKAYIEAETAAEMVAARAALRDHLNESYPGVDSRTRVRRDGIDRLNASTGGALSLFQECNYILWPAQDVKSLFGPPMIEEKDLLEFWFSAGSYELVFRFRLTDGLVTKIERDGRN